MHHWQQWFTSTQDVHLALFYISVHTHTQNPLGRSPEDKSTKKTIRLCEVFL